MDLSDSIKAISLREPGKLYIGGNWIEPASEEPFDLISPITEEHFYSAAQAGAEDVGKAVSAARAAFDEGPWPRMEPWERAVYLRRMGEILAGRGEELGHMWTAQIGLILSMAQYAGYAAKMSFDDFADLAETFDWETPYDFGDGAGPQLLVREPVGVVANIVPWNAALPLAVMKSAPALLAGCTVILKPAPETPLEAIALAEAAEEAGLPPGVFNVLPADREVAEMLVRNPGIDKVSFTGSSVAGMKIAQIMASRMGRYTMELGGKSPAIVLEDADPDTVAQQLSGAICRTSGQTCASLTRVIVPAAKHDLFADAFAKAMSGLKLGDPYAAETHLGPLAMKRQFDRVAGFIEQAKAEGADLVTGGGRGAGLDKGYFFQPTLFANVDNRMKIAREEIFGPVLSLIPARDVDEAVRIANDTPYGLNAAVFTSDSKRAYEIARRIRAGSVSQGQNRISFKVAFGGFKQSGVGREGSSAEGLLPFTETKTIYLDKLPG